jgi:hypothetical protein
MMDVGVGPKEQTQRVSGRWNCAKLHSLLKYDGRKGTKLSADCRFCFWASPVAGELEMTRKTGTTTSTGDNMVEESVLLVLLQTINVHGTLV